MSDRLSRGFKVIFFFCSLLILVFGLVLAVLFASLPRVIKPKEYKPMIISEVFAEKGEKIGEFYELRRKPVPLDAIPKVVIHAFLSAEDSHFFSHKGIDLRGIVRAAIKNFIAGRVVQGGSTITQQVAKNLLLSSRERKISRKVKEVLLAMRLEKELSKEEILYLYLNEIYLGHGAYGVQAASQNYFGKNISALSLAEAAILAGLPQAPSRYSPLINAQMAKERQIYVLGRMVADGYISKLQAHDAKMEVLNFLKKQDFNLQFAPYFVEHVRRYLIEKYGNEKVLQEGLQVYTTLNLDFQKAANLAMEKGLRDVDKRQGYRGPLRHLDKTESESFLSQQAQEEVFEEGNLIQAVVSEVKDDSKKVIVRFGKGVGEILFKEMRWARKPNRDKYYLENLIAKPSEALAVGDVVLVRIIEKKEPRFYVTLEQEPLVQGALLSFDTQAGFVKAMIGGYDFSQSEFNRAIQARRQVGSTFKPIIYGAALERGYTPSTIIVDSPIVYKEDESEILEKWKPKNFGEKFYGDTTLANALAFSRNIVTIKIAQDVSVDYIVDFARRMGIESPLIEDLSMALGSSSITLEEMCKAFAVYARGGAAMKPVFITKVVDREGNVLESYEDIEKHQQGNQIVSPQLAYLMTHLLKRVIQIGTGKNVSDLNWPLAGKTGTTSEYVDAWFVGYSPDILTGVWVGFDQSQKIGEYETGAKAAIPIWKDIMSQVLPSHKKRDFPVPDGIVFVNVDAKTGKLASDKTDHPISMPFIEKTEPKVGETQQDRLKRDIEEEQFFKENL